jgi:radical SAM protein with 4Fe4S-binding SPASM domain
MPQLNPDGSVSSCDMALYKDTKQELQCFIYGIWNADDKTISYDQDKITLLKSRNLINLPKCTKCPVKEYCAGGCAGRVAFQTGSIFDVIPDYCEATIYLANAIECGQNRIPDNESHP